MVKVNKLALTYFDFCAGIGGGHTAMSRLGGKCVGFSEIDSKSELTYRVMNEVDTKSLTNWGDLTKIESASLPEFDIMLGGFPCQAFSIVGLRRGFKDERGQIIFNLARILAEKSVKFFVLENVKGLITHGKKKTMEQVIRLLNDSGYRVWWDVLKTSDYGIPQIRERVYLVGARVDLVPDNYDFCFPEPIPLKKNLTAFLVDEDPAMEFNPKSKNWSTFIRYLNNKYNIGKFSVEGLLSKNNIIVDWRQSDLRIYEDYCPTLRTGRHGILYVKDGRFRRLSGFESLLLQGFDSEQAKRASEAKIPNSVLLSQSGNAFTVDVIEMITTSLINQFDIGKHPADSELLQSYPVQSQLWGGHKYKIPV